MTDPMFRCFARESTSFTELLGLIRARLTTINDIGSKKLNTTAPQRELIATLTAHTVPKEMLKFIGADLGMADWITDLGRRMVAVDKIIKSPSFGKSEGIWLGGLMTPEAWITATRQSVAHHKQVSQFSFYCLLSWT